MDAALGKLQSLYDKLTHVGVQKANVDVLNESIEPNFIQMSLYFAECHHKWLRAEQELGSCKEILTKTETEKEALKVKLKHSQNQVHEEIRRRQKAEADCEKLDRQIQLMRELPFSEGSSSIQLSAEQRSPLAFFNINNQAASNLNPSCKIRTKDGLASILSNISHDKTDDSLDLDTSTVRIDRLRKREKCVRFSKSAKPEDECKQPSLPKGETKTPPSTPKNNGGVHLHKFVSKTGVLSDYVPETSPMIPSLIVHCISQIEQRGLNEPGLYSVPGVDSRVKELKEKFHTSKTVPVLSEGDDIHAITGLLKNFLQNLKEPLLTVSLHQSFMDLAEDGNSTALMYQTIGELPQPNRDTLAFLMLHLQRVANSEETRMGIKNLAVIFGPTIVGHAVQNPEPMIILKDSKRQFKVVARLLSLPCDYWAQFVTTENGQPNLNH